MNLFESILEKAKANFANQDPTQNLQYKFLAPIESGIRSFSQNLQQGGQQLSDISMQHAQNVTNKGYRDEEKVKKVVTMLIEKGYDQNTINQTVKKLDEQGKFQGSWSQNPLSGTMASVESGLSKGLGTMFQGISNIGSAPLQETGTAGVTRFAKGAMETGLGSAQMATSGTPLGLGVNTAFTSETAGRVLQPISKGIETGIAGGQSMLGYNPESSVSKDIQSIGSTAGTIALLGGVQKGAKYIAPKVGTTVSKITTPIIKAPSGIKEAVTRKIPIGVMERDISLTPTERATIETIQGKPAGAVALEWNLPKDKQTMADALSTKADQAYNGITESVKPITQKVQSPQAKEALGIMYDEMVASPILVRTMKPYIDKIGQMIKQGDYSLSELNAVKRDFDRIIGNKIFDSKGRVSGIEDKAIAKIREDLSSQLQSEAQKYGIDIKAQNDILRTSIALRDGVLRRLSQENKNNKIGLQDIGVGAILSAGEPLTAGAVIFGKKALEANAPGIAQKLYNLNKTPYAKSNLKRGVTISPRDTTNGLSITPSNVSRPRISVKKKKK